MKLRVGSAERTPGSDGKISSISVHKHYRDYQSISGRYKNDLVEFHYSGDNRRYMLEAHGQRVDSPMGYSGNVCMTVEEVSDLFYAAVKRSPASAEFKRIAQAVARELKSL